jgi:hypothetical protein
MGLLDFGFGQSARNHVLRSSVNSWRSKLEFPDLEDLEELPFTDPHYYSSSESSEEDTESESAQPVLRDSQKPEIPQLEQPLIAQAPPLLPPIQHPKAPLVMQKFDYSNVVFSQWPQWEGQKPQQNYKPEYSRKYGKANTDDSGYRRMIGPVRYTRFDFSGKEVQYSSDESDGENDEENKEGILSLPSMLQKTLQSIGATETGTDDATASSSAPREAPPDANTANVR